MKQIPVDAERLAQKLCAAINIKKMTLEEIASKAGIDQSRVSRFRAGEFRRVTPTLEKLCRALEVRWRDYVLEEGLKELPEDFLISLRRLVGKNPRRIQAVRRLVRSVESLVKERD